MADRSRKGRRGAPEPKAYCPACFALAPREARRCAACGSEISALTARSYEEKLLAALFHPLAEVRMRAIIALGRRGEVDAARALVECALRHPRDVVEGLEVLRSLNRLEAGQPRMAALRMLAQRHPANAIKEAAARALARPFEAPANARRDCERRTAR